MNYLLQVSDNWLSIVPSGSAGIGSVIPNNRLIHVTIKEGLSGYMPGVGAYDVLDEDFEFWFTTMYCPLYSTPRRVKLLAGPTADGFIDDTIYRLIYKNSLDGIELWNLNRSQSFSATRWGCTSENVPFKLKKYVECKTAYDLLAIAEQAGAGSATGGQRKTLGDMTVSYDGPPAGSDSDAPDRKKELFDCWNDMLRVFRAQWPAVKGYYDSSKGYSHPVREPYHNRVIRPVIWNKGQNQPNGPWWDGYYWRGYTRS